MVVLGLLRQRNVAHLCLIAATLCLSFTSSANAIWQVKGEDSGYVYLIGDPRALKQSDYPLDPLYDEVFKSSAVILTEVDFIKLNQKGNDRAQSRSMVDPNTTSLRRRLEPKEWRRLVKAMKTLGIERVETMRLKPSIIASLLYKENLRQRGYEAPTLSQYFYTKASANRKTFETLEPSEDYLYFMNSRDRASAQRIIKFTLDSIDTFHTNMKQKRLAWNSGDLDHIYKAYTAPLASELPQVSKILIDERTEQWMPRILKQLSSYQTVAIVLGMEYLPGDTGVIQRLKTAGYTVTLLADAEATTETKEATKTEETANTEPSMNAPTDKPMNTDTQKAQEPKAQKAPPPILPSPTPADVATPQTSSEPSDDQ